LVELLESVIVDLRRKWAQCILCTETARKMKNTIKIIKIPFTGFSIKVLAVPPKVA
jgi:hypothetical protein